MFSFHTVQHTAKEYHYTAGTAIKSTRGFCFRVQNSTGVLNVVYVLYVCMCMGNILPTPTPLLATGMEKGWSKRKEIIGEFP